LSVINITLIGGASLTFFFIKKNILEQEDEPGPTKWPDPISWLPPYTVQYRSCPHDYGFPPIDTGYVGCSHQCKHS